MFWTKMKHNFIAFHNALGTVVKMSTGNWMVCLLFKPVLLYKNLKDPLFYFRIYALNHGNYCMIIYENGQRRIHNIEEKRSNNIVQYSLAKINEYALKI